MFWYGFGMCWYAFGMMLVWLCYGVGMVLICDFGMVFVWCSYGLNLVLLRF